VPPRKRIMFHGAGEVAEIGFVCLQETDLLLTGVIDDTRVTRFFGRPVYPSSWLASRESLDEFDVLVVMAFGEAEVSRVSAHLAASNFPPARLFWI